MLNIQKGEANTVILEGRFDASQVEAAKQFFTTLSGDQVVDFSRLEYISSAGLGVLLATQQRLKGAGAGLKLVNVSRHIRDVFHFSGFDQIFVIE